MTIEIKVFSDYVCPFCYIGKATFNEAIKNKNVNVRWMPFELRPSSAPPIYPEQMQGLFDQAVKPLAERLNVNMSLPEMSPHPRTPIIHEGFLYAKEHNKGTEYNEMVYKMFWEEQKDIGDIAVLKEVVKQIDLDADEFENALNTRKYKNELEAYLKKAAEDHISSIPTFIIGGQRLQGVQSKETIEQLIQAESDKFNSTDLSNASCNIDGCD
ncbi:DsbA family oxidoreductase [Chengkuizengella axinellae]|uniref:DsbA family oxidoreductase n=1 Tax=Chengkuizengella axinellae TaxID=3064388 RepID=A0ABT9IXK1_9BACL|nr:DsbA family oxidoreductase [Chengkuizengella sp. 2205SS18-9]MDP5274038.1 DsbA family oxidoreductase [Chengkuizengella sp. 2205SS18-9]